MANHTRNRMIIFVFSVAGLTLLNTTGAHAQEEELDYLNPESGIYEAFETPESPKPSEVLIKTEKSTQERTTSKSHSVKSKKATKKDSLNTSSGPTSGYASDTKEAESVLSFNFLYYIIQKFKFTDIVDQ